MFQLQNPFCVSIPFKIILSLVLSNSLLNYSLIINGNKCVHLCPSPPYITTKESLQAIAPFGGQSFPFPNQP